MTKAGSTEKVVREIRRHTRRRPALDDPTVVRCFRHQVLVKRA